MEPDRERHYLHNDIRKLGNVNYMTELLKYDVLAAHIPAQDSFVQDDLQLER
jgi:hypothetical protein